MISAVGHSHGERSSTSECFDIGNTVRNALEVYLATGASDAGSTDPRSAGNGSIMRLAPVVIHAFPDVWQGVALARESSLTTHGTATCLDACGWLAAVLGACLRGADREHALFSPTMTFQNGGSVPLETDEIRAVAAGDWRDKTQDEIRGTGYVVRSLEAALWCVHTTDSFADAVLTAANLGDDADTTAAISGQVAGALYGASAIPAEWLEALHLHDEIRRIADRLTAAAPAGMLWSSDREGCLRRGPGGRIAGEILEKLDGIEVDDLVRWTEAQERTPGVISMGYAVYHPDLSWSIDRLDDVGWTGWYSREQTVLRKMLDDPKRVASASPADVMGLITLMVRAERFNEGVWATIVADGLLQRVLQRLGEFD